MPMYVEALERNRINRRADGSVAFCTSAEEMRMRSDCKSLTEILTNKGNLREKRESPMVCCQQQW